MLEINREQMFTIGIVNHVPHPVVVNNYLHNVPQKGFYDIAPGAYFGIYKPDTFWFDEARR
jgi:peptide/nickel transport system substrate-binding protein